MYLRDEYKRREGERREKVDGKAQKERKKREIGERETRKIRIRAKIGKESKSRG